MNEEQNEIKRMGEQKDKQQSAIEKLAYEVMVENGKKYLEKNGPDMVKKQVEQIKVDLAVWNKLGHASIRFSLQTIETMLQVYHTIPYVIGLDIVKNPQYILACMRLSAIRNAIIEENQAKAKTALNNLSTGSGISL